MRIQSVVFAVFFILLIGIPPVYTVDSANNAYAKSQSKAELNDKSKAVLNDKSKAELKDDEVISRLTAKAKTEYFELYFDPRYKDDADKEVAFLEQGIAQLKKEFSGFPVDKLLKVDCKVYLFPEETCDIGAGYAAISSGIENDKYFAKIKLLTPSQCPPSYRNNVNEAASDDLSYKLIVHEYCTILLDQISRHKKQGVRFHSCPRWFEQGYEEYCALMLTSEHNRTETLSKFLKKLKDNPNRVDFNFGISAENDYLDGAMLVLFLNDEFGKQKVQDILASEQPTFGKAAIASLGVGVPELKDRWDKWLERRLSSAGKDAGSK